MKSKHIFLLSIFLLVLFQLAFAQVGVGQWQDHLPYTNGICVTESESHIYSASKEAIISYNKSSGEIERLNKITGLSDIGIQSIAFSINYKTLIIGYTNGNIDLLKNNQLVNIADIKRKTISSEKSINHILFIDNYAILSTGFGIVLLDVERQEIKSTWYIGEMASYINIFETDFDGEYIYAATENGIYKGDYYNNNLADYNQWEIITNVNQGGLVHLQNKNYNTLEYFKGELIINKHNTLEQHKDTLYVYDNNTWRVFSDTSLHDCAHLSSNDQFVAVTMPYSILTFEDINQAGEKTYEYKFQSTGEVSSPTPSMAIPGLEDQLIIADRTRGLVKQHGIWNDQEISINGPSSAKVFDISSAGNNVWVVSGGYNSSYVPTFTHGQVNINRNNEWTSITRNNTDAFENILDLVSIIVNPYNPSQAFAGSWVNGILEFQNNQVVKVYNETNSTIEAIGDSDMIRIGSLAFDKNQNLWITNSGAGIPIHVRTPNNQWYGLDYSTHINVFNIGDIIITKNNHKWVVLPGKGIFVFDENETFDNMNDDRKKRFNVVDEGGKIISNKIHSIAEDHDGSIWVGTDQGVVIYYDPEDVFEKDLVAHKVLIPRNDGTNKADPLLGAETVTAICVDGANKKWFGTQNGGVFQTSADGIEEIHHFNTGNSPLFSNNIITMNINGESGEVYIGTEAGLLSYRGEATEGEEDYTDVYTFPNPVEPDYEGPITIHGLVAGSTVKITDISGNLVFETRSEGGQAIWYGKNLNGDRVHTGVYLVFSANEDGTQSNVTKILFVN